MRFTDQLATAERQNQSLLCVGLDPEPSRFPGGWQHDPARIFDFCATIVDATRDLVLAFKPQIAYFAANRAEDQLERLVAHIHRVAPNVPVILDAKRGDVGSTAEQYAREAFERYQADAVTLSPFMGHDSVEPYLRYDGKGAFLLCRTSNPGGDDLQSLVVRPAGAGAGGGGGTADDATDAAGPRGTGSDKGSDTSAGGEALYETVARIVNERWNTGGQLGLVVGATYPAEIERVRRLAPTLPLLIPGIGAQGGDAEATVRAGWRGDAGETTAPIVVSSSRAILYASRGSEFAAAARAAALATRDQLNAARRCTGPLVRTEAGIQIPAGVGRTES